MNFSRRSFFRRAGGLIASVAIAQGVVRKLFDTVTNPVSADLYVDIQSGDLYYRKAFQVSPWIKLVEAGEFPKDMGSTIRGVR